MKRFALLLAILAFASGCIIDAGRHGQTIEIDGDGARPHDGYGYDNGMSLDQSRP